MPAEKTISEIYRHQFRDFSKHLELARNLAEKNVHNLRVDIKNLRVLFVFLESLSPKKFKSSSLLKILKPVFKKAGAIRSQHLNLKLASPYRSALMSRFKSYLKEQEIKVGKAFLKEIQIFDSKAFKKLHHKNLEVLKKLKQETIRKKCETQSRRILAKLHEDFFELDGDEALHQIRKRLKSLKSMNHLHSKITASPTIGGIEVKKLKNIYDKLGIWHDGLIFAETFEKFVFKQEGPDSADQATALLLKLIDKNEKNKSAILKKLRLDLVEQL